MDALAALPTWLQVVLAVLAAVVLVVLNAGWFLAAKANLDARKREYAERKRPGAEGSKQGSDRLSS